MVQVGLSERADHFPAQLSGDEQQRVAIARAIVKRPDMLVCRRPTDALGDQTGKHVLKGGLPLGRRPRVQSAGVARVQIMHENSGLRWRLPSSCLTETDR